MDDDLFAHASFPCTSSLQATVVAGLLWDSALQTLTPMTLCAFAAFASTLSLILPILVMDDAFGNLLFLGRRLGKILVSISTTRIGAEYWSKY